MSSSNPTLWIRPEDADHPKLDRLRKAVGIEVGPENEIDRPWLTMASGMSKDWLDGMLSRRAQVLILPPWPQGSFAGLPAVTLTDVPGNELRLGANVYRVAASRAIEASRAWRAQGVFESSELAWLVFHEPYVGAGCAWLCTAELLLANPKSRPSDLRGLIAEVASLLTDRCGKGKSTPDKQPQEERRGTLDFSPEEGPYLLALLNMENGTNAEDVVEFLRERINVDGNIDIARRLLEREELESVLQRPADERHELKSAIDALGLRPFRLELEETR